MYHFIVRDDEDIVLAVRIGHGERHLVVIVFAEVRVALLIFQKIIHPAHVPLEVKAKTAVFRIACDHRPCRGFFRNHNRTRLALMHNGI